MSVAPKASGQHRHQDRCAGLPPPTFEIGRGGHVANSNLGNGNLRPETFGKRRVISDPGKSRRFALEPMAIVGALRLRRFGPSPAGHATFRDASLRAPGASC
jgi:hypothetical protein